MSKFPIEILGFEFWSFDQIQEATLNLENCMHIHTTENETTWREKKIHVLNRLNRIRIRMATNADPNRWN